MFLYKSYFVIFLSFDHYPAPLLRLMLHTCFQFFPIWFLVIVLVCMIVVRTRCCLKIILEHCFHQSQVGSLLAVITESIHYNGEGNVSFGIAHFQIEQRYTLYKRNYISSYKSWFKISQCMIQRKLCSAKLHRWLIK